MCVITGRHPVDQVQCVIKKVGIDLCLLAGGNETTILDIVNALFCHGMIVQGDPQGDHYGPVSINMSDERTENQCVRLGERVAQLVKKLQ